VSVQLPTETDLSAVPGGRREEPLQVVVAVRRPLAGHRAPHRIGHQEDPDLLALALRERVREPQAVVRALRPIRRVVEHKERLHRPSIVVNG
jgi:hypothetical protein